MRASTASAFFDHFPGRTYRRTATWKPLQSTSSRPPSSRRRCQDGTCVGATAKFVHVMQAESPSRTHTPAAASEFGSLDAVAVFVRQDDEVSLLEHHPDVVKADLFTRSSAEPLVTCHDLSAELASQALSANQIVDRLAELMLLLGSSRSSSSRSPSTYRSVMAMLSCLKCCLSASRPVLSPSATNRANVIRN